MDSDSSPGPKELTQNASAADSLPERAPVTVLCVVKWSKVAHRSLPQTSQQYTSSAVAVLREGTHLSVDYRCLGTIPSQITRSRQSSRSAVPWHFGCLLSSSSLECASYRFGNGQFEKCTNLASSSTVSGFYAFFTEPSFFEWGSAQSSPVKRS